MAGVEKPFLNDEMCDKSHELFELWDTDGDGIFLNEMGLVPPYYPYSPQINK